MKARYPEQVVAAGKRKTLLYAHMTDRCMDIVSLVNMLHVKNANLKHFHLRFKKQ